MGSPPPPDALPLDAQIPAGIGVPPPANPMPPGGGGNTGGAAAGFGISAGLSLQASLPIPSQISAAASVSFQPTLPGIFALCGFTLPGFNFSFDFSLQLPSFSLDFLFLFGLSLNCDLANPIEATVAFGGGRLPPIAPPELDVDFLAAA